LSGKRSQGETRANPEQIFHAGMKVDSEGNAVNDSPSQQNQAQTASIRGTDAKAL